MQDDTADKAAKLKAQAARLLAKRGTAKPPVKRAYNRKALGRVEREVLAEAVWWSGAAPSNDAPFKYSWLDALHARVGRPAKCANCCDRREKLHHARRTHTAPNELGHNFEDTLRVRLSEITAKLPCLKPTVCGNGKHAERRRKAAQTLERLGYLESRPFTSELLLEDAYGRDQRLGHGQRRVDPSGKTLTELMQAVDRKEQRQPRVYRPTSAAVSLIVQSPEDYFQGCWVWTDRASGYETTRAPDEYTWSIRGEGSIPSRIGVVGSAVDRDPTAENKKGVMDLRPPKANSQWHPPQWTALPKDLARALLDSLADEIDAKLHHKIITA